MSATAAAAFDATAAASMFDSSNSLDSSAAVSDRSLHASAAADIHAFNPNSVWTTGYNPLEYVWFIIHAYALCLNKLELLLHL